MSQETDLGFEEILRALGAGGKTKGEAKTLDEVFTPKVAAVDATIRPEREEHVLPIPHDGMTLKELRDLSVKYKAVIESGAYLALWTDLKATPVSSIDPEIEGRGAMSTQMEEAYDWFRRNGNLEEFDWRVARRKGSTPPGRQGKLKQEILALRVMYKNDKLDDENLYYIRESKPAHFQVVLAFVCIIRAANNINQGVTKGGGYDYKEYQTCNKIIGSSGAIVNKFMELIHTYTRPIEEVKQLLMARRYDVAQKIGMPGVKAGGAVRDAEEFNRPLPGKVTAPTKAPHGMKRLREDYSTIAKLREMAVTKRTKMSEMPAVARLTLTTTMEDKDYNFDDPVYVPEGSPSTLDMRPITAMSNHDLRRWGDILNSASADGNAAAEFARIRLSSSERKVLNNAAWRQTTDGEDALAANSKMTNLVKVVVAATNRLIRIERAAVLPVQQIMSEGKLHEFVVGNKGFVEPGVDYRGVVEGIGAGEMETE
jgi:hypothetical protein